MQELLINELDQLEDQAWSTFNFERTPEQMEAIQDATEEWLDAVLRKDLDSVRTFEMHVPAFFAIGLCRRILEEYKDPADSLAALVQTSVWLGRIDMLFKMGKEPQFSLQQSALQAVVAGISDKAKSAMARKAADALHAENREIAERIKAWYIENHRRFRSMDAAAEAATKIEPVSFRTARKHVGGAAKYLRSARKA